MSLAAGPLGRPTTSTRIRHVTADVLFFVFLAVYTIFALTVLALGAVAAIAAVDPSLHQGLHVFGIDANTLFERTALGMASVSHHSEPGLQLALDYGFSVVNLVLGLYLVWLRPHNPTARLLAIGMVGTAAVFNLQALSVYDAMQVTTLDTQVHFGFELIAMLAYLYALLTFPDGKLVPRWHPAFLALLYLPITLFVSNVLYQLQGTALRIVIVLAFGLLTPFIGVLAQAYRWLRSKSSDERRLSKLLFWALLPALIVVQFIHPENMKSYLTPGLEGRALETVPLGFFRLFQPVFTIIPIALFIGIIRYRLWDIDRIISRTLIYGLLGAFVSAVYVGVVVGVGNLIGAQQHNLLLSIVATGLVAVAFQPVRERVTRLANRVVYGNRATPYEALAAVSRMTESVSSDDLLQRMVRVLAQSTGARQAGVWLKVGREMQLAATWPPRAAEGRRPLAGDHLPVFENVDRAVAVRHQGELLGALTVSNPPGEPLSSTEDKLISDLAAQAGLVLRNAGLTAELRARLEDLQQSRQRLVTAQDVARRTLERNIHDGAQQQLVALKVKLSLAERLVEKDPVKVRAMLAQLKEETDEAVQALRELARGIYPPLLASDGLCAALQAHARKVPIPVEVNGEGIARYAQEAEGAVYFCCLEALQNVVKSSHATQATVRLRAMDGWLHFTIEDDGVGFDTTAVRRGAGLQNMIDRVEALRGAIEVESAPGKGTRVIGKVPVRVREVAGPPS